jgi:hypothetical protein
VRNVCQASGKQNPPFLPVSNLMVACLNHTLRHRISPFVRNANAISLASMESFVIVIEI